MYTGLHAKYRLCLTDFNSNQRFSTNFRKKIFIYEISSKSVRWEPNCSMWTNRQTLRKQSLLSILRACLKRPDITKNSCELTGLGSSVGIATGYGLDGPGIESRWEARFSQLTRPALGPTQPPVQWSFPGVKSGRGVTLTPLPLLVLWSRKSRAITLLLLWAVRLVQSLSACTRVHFTFLLFTLRS